MNSRFQLIRYGVATEQASILAKFLRDESGQDLIEYALLSLFIGVCAVLAVVNIPPAIANAYSNWNANVQSISSCTPDPGGGGC